MSTASDSVSGIALVTGASKGIGKATALLFATRGVRGLVLASRTASDLESAASEAKAVAINPSFEVLTVATDVTSDDAIRALLKAAKDKFGRIDYAVNAAGVIAGEFVRFSDSSVDEVDSMFKLNQRAVWVAVQEEIRAMTSQSQSQDGSPARGGAIVNIGSIVSVNTKRLAGTYVPTKYAVEGITKTAAIDHACDGIRVNAVLPGYTQTEGLVAHPNANAELVKYINDRTPLGRLAEAKEVAEVVVFLASGQASFVTGACWVVDGGFSIS